jgi:hypothetical protein
MRAAKLLAVLAIAALGIGSFSAVALAGKKKKTVVRFQHEHGLTFKSGKVTAKGGLSVKFPVVPGERCGSRCQTSRSRWLAACRPSRSMRLQVLDTNGVVLTTLDGSTSDANGNWKLSGQLPTTLPAGTNYVRVKAKKRTVGKFVCQAGVSPTVAIPAV